jgi:hypothetical protein
MIVESPSPVARAGIDGRGGVTYRRLLNLERRRMSSGERQPAPTSSLTPSEHLLGICGLFLIGLIGALCDRVERFH